MASRVLKVDSQNHAKFLKGMLTNPSIAPNTTINQWIENVLMYHFTLRHCPGKTFGLDGLSRRDPQPGDKDYPKTEDWEDEPVGLEGIEYPDEPYEEPLEPEEFHDKIDYRGGYLYSITEDSLKLGTKTVDDLQIELMEAQTTKEE